MHDHLLHSLSGRLQIASRVEIRRILAECFTDGTCHSQTDIGVDIDLADSHRGSLAEHVFRDAFRTEDFAAIGIALFHKFRNDGRSAMEDDRVVWQELANLFQTFIVKIGVAFEFVCSVAGADRNSERVAAGKLYELSRFFRIRKDRILRIDADQIFYAGQTSELGFHHDTFVMCIFDDLLCDFDIFLEGVLRAIIHDGSKATVNAGLTDLIRRAVVQMECGRDLRIILKGSLDQTDDIFLTGIIAGAFRSLKNDRRLLFLGSFHDPLDDFHVIHIECTNGIMPLICLFKHFSSSYERHNDTFLSMQH